MHHTCYTLVIAAVMLIGGAQAAAAAERQSEWWNNGLGTQSGVLPGFEPIAVEGTRIGLYARAYQWSGGLFPGVIESRGTPIAASMRLMVRDGAQRIELKPHAVNVTEARPDRATIVAEGRRGTLDITVTTSIEYDGLARVKVMLSPSAPTVVDGLDYEVQIKDAPALTALAFKAETLRPQKQRNDLLPIPYRGDFINVLGFADGERSFWWFADNARNWIWNDATVTDVARSDGWITLRQKLIGSRWTVTQPTSFEFAFMATPVRDLGSKHRVERIVSAHPSSQEAALGGKYKLWWTDAFAHDAFAYLDYPQPVAGLVTAMDRQAYPGVINNRRRVLSDRLEYRIEWIPYFSAHCLSVLDPVLDEFRASWEVHPLASYRDGLNPYPTKFEKPLLTQRAEGYSDYLLWRLQAAMTGLDISGIYFDHGNVMDSANPLNGEWIDSNGKRRGSLDILAMRSFFKRLRTMFVAHGKAGDIFVHDSNREIIPAYSFVTATVDGEQYRRSSRGGDILRDGDYLASVGLDEIRARFAPGQYGVDTVWLAEEWSNHSGEAGWQASEANRAAYRKLLALTLLHDIRDWDPFHHIAERQHIIEVLDRFGVGSAEFVGYWSARSIVRASDPSIKVSYYVRDDRRRLLLVATNTADHAIDAEVEIDSSRLAWAAQWRITDERGATTRQSTTKIRLKLPPRDFALIRME